MTSIQAASLLAEHLYYQYETPRRDYFYIVLPYDISNLLCKWLSKL